jgi:hypothetical protein
MKVARRRLHAHVNSDQKATTPNTGDTKSGPLSSASSEATVPPAVIVSDLLAQVNTRIDYLEQALFDMDTSYTVAVADLNTRFTEIIRTVEARHRVMLDSAALALKQKREPVLTAISLLQGCRTAAMKITDAQQKQEQEQPEPTATDAGDVKSESSDAVPSAPPLSGMVATTTATAVSTASPLPVSTPTPAPTARPSSSLVTLPPSFIISQPVAALQQTVALTLDECNRVLHPAPFVVEYHPAVLTQGLSRACVLAEKRKS